MAGVAKRLSAGLTVALAVAGFSRLIHAQSAMPPCGLELRVLVLSADGREAVLPAITRALDYLGTPYTTYIARSTPGGLTSAFLSDGCHANFNAVVQTTGELLSDSGSGWSSSLTPDEIETLHAFEAQFGIRQATWFTFPTPEFGFNWGTALDTSVDPLPVTLSPAGRAVFSYLNPSTTFAIQHAYAYLASPFGPETTPLVTDGSGHALAAVTSYADGRENLALTFDGNPNLLHTVLFGYGVLNWVTRGVFIGERRISMSPQVDDLFIDNDRWSADTTCATDDENTGETIRIDADDLHAVAAWQAGRNAQPATAGLRLTMAFNGEGTTGIYPNDTLTAAGRSLQSRFHWVSHTYTHPMLDDLGYAASLDEMRLNIGVAHQMALASFNPINLITPNITGLTNPEFLRAAVDAGVRYLVTDTSRPGYDNPAPNLGIYNATSPSILMIPRRPNNLFYNVATPADWTAEYNCLYEPFWQRRLSFDEIVDLESDRLLMNMLRGDIDPWMFHQPNLVAYDGAHTLLTDLLDRALDRYNEYFTLPIVSPTMNALGAEIERRMQLRAASLVATLQPGVGVTITSDKAVSVAVTGIASIDADRYGDQTISRISVPAGGTVTVPLTAPVPALPDGWTHEDIGAVGAAGDASYDGVGTYTVSGAGADVWGTADALQYAYRTMSGDVQITARVATVQNVHAWTKAGVMIRSAQDAGAAHAFMLVSPGKGLAFQRRAANGGTSVNTAGAMAAAPYWVRLERRGTLVSAYQSADGTAWKLVGSATIALGDQALVGLAVSSHTTSAAAAATFDRVTISPLATPPPSEVPPDVPAPWAHQDIGAVGAPGSASYDASASIFTVKGAGADVWGTADAFHFASQPWSGDVRIVARVMSVQAAHAWTKAGVMVRESSGASAPHASMFVSAAKGLAFQRRPAGDGVSVSTAGVFDPAPYWVRLDRIADTVTAYQSQNGTDWLKVGADTIPMASSVYVGLAVSSHTTSTAAAASFDNVSVTTPGSSGGGDPNTALPDGWLHQDIGLVGRTGAATFTAATGAFSIQGAGADIWGGADAFHFAFTTLAGDGTIAARVAAIENVQNVAPWVKAGVMIRETLDANAAHGLMLVSAGKGQAFQRRRGTGEASVSTPGPASGAPSWVKLERLGDTFHAYSSADGVNWILVGSDTMPMDQTVYVGLAVSSHTTAATATATFDSVTTPR